MLDLSSHVPLLIGIFATGTVLLLYTATKFAQNDPPTTVPVATGESESGYTFKTPDQWDQETPLQWCEECGTFNEAEYLFCAECTHNLSAGTTMPAGTIVKLKNEVEKQ